jgi:hypothetical protein
MNTKAAAASALGKRHKASTGPCEDLRGDERVLLNVGGRRFEPLLSMLMDNSPYFAAKFSPTGRSISSINNSVKYFSIMIPITFKC